MKTSSSNLPGTPPPCRDVDKGQQAFTRLDLLMVLIIVMAMTGVVLPLLANTRQRSEQAACANNLRQIGRAVHLWANDHGDWGPIRLPVSEGGLNPMGTGNPYIFFTFIKNELGTPRVLACPSDTKLVAKDFSTSPDGGLLHLNFRNNAVSYFVGLHAFPDEPFAWVSGDRNLRVDYGPGGCSAGINNAYWIRTSPPSQATWTNSVHQQSGNILFNSGAVEQLSTGGLLSSISMHTNSRISTIHLLIP